MLVICGDQSYGLQISRLGRCTTGQGVLLEVVISMSERGVSGYQRGGDAAEIVDIFGSVR